MYYKHYNDKDFKHNLQRIDLCILSRIATENLMMHEQNDIYALYTDSS